MMTDTELLDGLQRLATRPVVCRDSYTGRGWRLHETRDKMFEDLAFTDVRSAIENFLKEKNND